LSILSIFEGALRGLDENSVTFNIPIHAHDIAEAKNFIENGLNMSPT